jgi:hypothetical protein
MLCQILYKNPYSASFVFVKAILWLVLLLTIITYLTRDKLDPIMRVPVYVTCDEGTVKIDIMPGDEEKEQHEQVVALETMGFEIRC